MDHEKVSLGNLANGVAEELFQREVDAVMKNIEDINNPAEKARTITLSVMIKPTKDRSFAGVIIKCTSSLPGTKEVSSTMMFGKENGSLVAFQKKDEQQELDLNVVNIEEKANE